MTAKKPPRRSTKAKTATDRPKKATAPTAAATATEAPPTAPAAETPAFTACKSCPYPGTCAKDTICRIQATAAARGKEAREKAMADFKPCSDCEMPAGCAALARCRTELMRGRPDPVTRKPGKRPREYSADIAQKIMDGLVEGKGLREICEPTDMPSESRVRQWVVDDVGGFAAQYVRGRDIGIDVRADRIKDMAAMSVGLPNEGVQAVRLMVDTEKWYLSKIAPKRYGDRLDVNVKDDRLSDDELNTRLGVLVGRALAKPGDGSGGT